MTPDERSAALVTSTDPTRDEFGYVTVCGFDIRGENAFQTRATEGVIRDRIATAIREHGEAERKRAFAEVLACCGELRAEATAYSRDLSLDREDRHEYRMAAGGYATAALKIRALAVKP